MWKVPESDDFMTADHLQGEVSSELTYAETTSSWMKAGFNRAAASGAYMFCSASYEHSLSEKQAKSAYQKVLHMTGLWRFPRVTLILQDCTSASPKFVAAVREALAAGRILKEKGDVNPSAPLERVFSEFGHFVPTRVQLGGQLYFQSVRRMAGAVTEEEWHENVQAAVPPEASIGRHKGRRRRTDGRKHQKSGTGNS
jgi:hypothetical protein